MSPVRLSILIPVYNEAHSIKAVLQRVVAAPAAYFQTAQIDLDLIVVDDGSRDESHEEVQAFCREHPGISLNLIRHHVNSGKGAAICTAIAQAKGDFCIIQDADFEYDPLDYPKLLAPLVSGDADVVLGSRFMSGPLRRPLGFWQAVANRVITTLAGMAAGLDLSDVETGYKAFRTSLAQSVPLHSKRFGLDPEIIIQFAKRHARFMEVPISYRGRTHEQGKKIGVLDAFSGAGSIFRTWFFSASHNNPAADMLVAMSGARRFNKWMADTISPWVSGDVIEVGAGIGNLTVLLAPGCRNYLATDTDTEHLSELRSRTAYRRNVQIEICEFSNPIQVAPLRQTADTIVCLNVLEHVAEDRSCLNNIYQCLKPHGKAIILVPQGPSAFGSMDEVLDHKRRYTEADLRQKMLDAGFEVTQVVPFNRATWPGWYLNSRILKRRTLSRFQLAIFDWLVPLWRKIDSRLPWPPTSLIAIGAAKDHAAS
jgi:glycosyltransferase involved in cell wall biosynthesis